MALVDWEIRQAIKNGEIIIIPFEDKLINPDSLDIRLGNKFGLTYPEPWFTWVNNFCCEECNGTSPTKIIDPMDKNSFTTVWEEVETYILQPKEFILADMFETLTLPSNMWSEIRGKSSTGRLTIMNSSVAGVIDSAWSGKIIMELYNYGDFPIKLTAGMKIGQLLFHETNLPEKTYAEVGRYQNQKNGDSLGV